MRNQRGKEVRHMAKKASGLNRRQIGNRAKGVTRKMAANLARSKGMGGKGG